MEDQETYRVRMQEATSRPSLAVGSNENLKNKKWVEIPYNKKLNPFGKNWMQKKTNSMKNLNNWVLWLTLAVSWSLNSNHFSGSNAVKRKKK